MLRRRSRSMPTDDLELTAQRPVGVVSEDTSEDVILAAVDGELVNRALGRLSTRHRHVLAMREGSGWTYQQIADHEGVEIGTIETLLWRARQALKREFAVVSESKEALAGFLIATGALIRRTAFRAAQRGATVHHSSGGGSGALRNAVAGIAVTGAAVATAFIAPHALSSAPSGASSAPGSALAAPPLALGSTRFGSENSAAALGLAPGGSAPGQSGGSTAGAPGAASGNSGSHSGSQGSANAASGATSLLGGALASGSSGTNGVTGGLTEAAGGTSNTVNGATGGLGQTASRVTSTVGQTLGGVAGVAGQAASGVAGVAGQAASGVTSSVGSVVSGLNSTTQSIGLGSVLSGTSGSGSSGSASSSATPTPPPRRRRTQCRASSAQQPRPCAASSEGSWPIFIITRNIRYEKRRRPRGGALPEPAASLIEVQLSRRQRPRKRSRPSDRSPRTGPCWRSADGLPASPSCSLPSATGCGWMRPGQRCRS